MGVAAADSGGDAEGVGGVLSGADDGLAAIPILKALPFPRGKVHENRVGRASIGLPRLIMLDGRSGCRRLALQSMVKLVGDPATYSMSARESQSTMMSTLELFADKSY